MGVLEGQVAIVTGAGRGIGRQIAVDLATAGGKVGLVARTGAQLDEVRQEIEAAGGVAMALRVDVTDRRAVETSVAQVNEAWGAVTFLVNNAGIDTPFGPIGVVDPDDWWHTHDVHVRGALLFMHACLPAMRAAGWGRILNMASLGGTMIGANSSAYCVAKNTLIRLTEHVDVECRESGVRAFTGHPGTIVTEMLFHTLADPGARKHLPAGVIRLLESFTETDTSNEARRLGAQMVRLAAGEFDAEAGRYIDFEQELRPAEFGPAPDPVGGHDDD